MSVILGSNGTQKLEIID